MVLVLQALYTTAQIFTEVTPMPHIISMAICHEERRTGGRTVKPVLGMWCQLPSSIEGEERVAIYSFHLECHDTERLESIEYGWGGHCAENGTELQILAELRKEGVLPEQKAGLDKHDNESPPGLENPDTNAKLIPLHTLMVDACDRCRRRMRRLLDYLRPVLPRYRL